MKLSFDILKEHSRIPVKDLIANKSSTDLSLPRPIFATDKNVLLADTLYISYSDDAAFFRRVSEDAFLILIGDMPSGEAEKAAGILLFGKDADIMEVFNEVTRIFDLFDDWESAIRKAAMSSSASEIYQKILDASSVIFDNGLSVMSYDFRIVFQNQINRQYAGYEESTLGSRYSIGQDYMDYFKHDRDYQRITQAREVFCYSGDILPHKVMCKNIFLNDRFLFRIIITECIRPLRETDRVLLEHLSKYILQSLEHFTFSSSFAESSLSGIIKKELETGKSSRLAAESALRKLHWETGHAFLVMSIHTGEDDLMIAALNFHASEIMNSFPETIAFPYKDSVIAVINMSRAGEMDKYFERFRVFIRENNFRVGISNESEDFHAVRQMYDQAEMAHTIGEEERPTEWIHWFSDYTMAYIYRLLGDTELGELYSPVYYMLQKYDSQNGTSYLETLRVYLECGMNTVQASKALYIQRSTMIYRLKRIREITNNHLEDRDELLHLHLTFAIIEQGGRNVHRP